MRKKWKLAAAAAVFALLLSGCGKGNSAPFQGQQQEEVNKETEANVLSDQQHQELRRAAAAIEGQLPELTFEDIPAGEVEAAVSFFKDSYIFEGRKADNGYSYILGLRTAEENPLEDLSCGNGGQDSDYSASQFADGTFLLLEKGAAAYGISGLYDCLNEGMEGIAYMEDARERGVFLVPPAEEPFLRVRMVKDGVLRTEYLPLSKEKRQELFPEQYGAEGLQKSPVGDQDQVQEEAQAVQAAEEAETPGMENTGAVDLFENREDMEKNFMGHPEQEITREAMEFVKETCGFQADSLDGISEIESAGLTGNFETGTRTETLSGRAEMERLRELLGEAVLEDSPMNGRFPGRLVLKLSSGKELNLWLSDVSGAEDTELAVGNASFYRLSRETAESLWRLFGTVDGYRRYGDQIWMEMKEEQYSPDDGELTFILHNETGAPIQYILSPIIQKWTEEDGEESWIQVESIAGFCGFLTGMEGEEKELAVPWSGSFQPSGSGIYRLGIQVSPEPELRFAINAEFELAESQGEEQ